MNSKARLEIRVALDIAKLEFVGIDDRMNYGVIGWLATTNGKNKKVVTICQNNFYVADKNFPISQSILKIIDAIQREFWQLEVEGKKCKLLTFS